MKTKKRKCDFCGKTIDAERVYKWRTKVFCSANCKREYRLKERKETRNKQLVYLCQAHLNRYIGGKGKRTNKYS